MRCTPLEIVGDGGVLRADDAFHVERPIQLELWQSGKRVTEESLSNHLASARQVDCFATSIENGGVFPVTGEQGWKNQLILDAAYRSLFSGKSEEVSTW